MLETKTFLEIDQYVCKPLQMYLVPDHHSADNLPELGLKESSYRRLVFPDKLIIRSLVMKNSHLCNQSDVVKLIQNRLLHGFTNHHLSYTVAGKHQATAYKEIGIAHKCKHNSHTYTQ